MNKYNCGGLIRITKKTACKLYNSGVDVIILPHKANPFYSGFYPSYFNINSTSKPFDNFINEFTYYNCCNELGYYPAFYIKEGL